MQSHAIDCGKMNNCAIRLPNKDKWLEFENYNHKERIPFIVDLEYSTKNKTQEGRCVVHVSTAQSMQCGLLRALFVRWCVIVVSVLSRWRLYSVVRATTPNLTHRVKNIISANYGNARKNKEAYRNATRCYICEKSFTPDDPWVRDHCHLTDRYRGPVHSNCNLNYKNLLYISVIFWATRTL